MRFEVLGPLRVHVGGREVVVRAGRDRTLLAMLLLHADRTVSVDQLVDALWSDAPPRSARNQVQACVSQLRKRLSQAGLPEDVIVTDPAGYRLRVGPEQVDVHRFRALIEAARAEAAAGRRTDARDRYRAALDLWRGKALAGIESTEVRRAATALDEEHVRAIEERIELDLALGGAGELVGELSDLVQRYPYREGLHAALMHALYRAGRMADALDVFRQARQMLRDELGAEPGEELQRLHQAILNRDLEIVVTQPREPAVANRPVPHELSTEVSCFVGRDKEIAQVCDTLAPATDTARRRPAVVLLYGPGGVGKSAPAVRAAHELAGKFPDGQLYVDLCGSTPRMRPLGALEVLGRFLRSLGVHPREIPSNEVEAAAFLRSVTADRRLLFVLDNAAAKNHIVPLLPANPDCSALVTSRYAQPSLDVDLRLRVAVLDRADGLTLLTGLTDRLAADSDSTHEILALTAGLPLAVRIAGSRLACRPDLSAAEYAARLAVSSRRLDELQIDDLAVRASVLTSYDVLGASTDPVERMAAHAFQLLGILPVPDVAAGVVAALLGESDTAGSLAALERLVDTQLLEPVGGGRYRFHDLVRLVAAERASENMPEGERDAALRRAMTFYFYGTHRADTMLHLSSVPFLDDPPEPHRVLESLLKGPAQARTWIDRELNSLVSLMEHSTIISRVHCRLLLQLAQTLWNILDARCAWPAAHSVSRAMVKIAEENGDQRAMAAAFMLHGRSEACLGNDDIAVDHLERAHRLFTDSEVQPGAALALNGLGLVRSRQGDPGNALSYYGAALEIARQLRLTHLTATVLLNASASYTCSGQLDRAINAAEEALATCPDSDQMTCASAMINLSGAYCLRGNHAEAVQCADDAVRLCRESGDSRRECEALIGRSESNFRRGRFSDAYLDAAEALSLAEMTGYRFVAAAALRQQARVLAATGRADAAAGTASMARERYGGLHDSLPDPLIELLLGVSELRPDQPRQISAT